MTGSENLFRVYDPETDDFDNQGYPRAWQQIKRIVRAEARHRCVRCHHPYRNGEHGNGEWSRCDAACTHAGPVRVAIQEPEGPVYLREEFPSVSIARSEARRQRDSMLGGGIDDAVTWVEAQWRILTTHHLTGEKFDCRWWNLVALDQRCHLQIQGKVKMDRRWDKPHTEWFRPYVAGFYAWRFLGEDLTREETLARIGELLALEHRQQQLSTGGL